MSDREHHDHNDDDYCRDKKCEGFGWAIWWIIGIIVVILIIAAIAQMITNNSSWCPDYGKSWGSSGKSSCEPVCDTKYGHSAFSRV